jgi:hypothetical protein
MLAHLVGRHKIRHILSSLLFPLAFPLPHAAAAAAAAASATAAAGAAAEFEELAAVDGNCAFDCFLASAARHTSKMITTPLPCCAVVTAAHSYCRRCHVSAWRHGQRLAARGAVDMHPVASCQNSNEMSMTTTLGRCITTGIWVLVRKKA